MLELEVKRLPKIKVGDTSTDDKPINVNDVIRRLIKESPPLDLNRGDMQRGETYYITGGDPDKRNPI